ncbi:hypothetical protein D3C80_1481490 [compost metagenome]
MFPFLICEATHIAIKPNIAGINDATTAIWATSRNQVFIIFFLISQFTPLLVDYLSRRLCSWKNFCICSITSRTGSSSARSVATNRTIICIRSNSSRMNTPRSKPSDSNVPPKASSPRYTLSPPGGDQCRR